MDYRKYLCEVLEECGYMSLPDIVCSVIISITQNSFLCETTINAYHMYSHDIVAELVRMCHEENIVEKEERGGKFYFRKRFNENKPCYGN